MINENKTWVPTGELTTETALATLAKGQQQIDHATKECVIDLAQIHTVDSAGVAVLLAWQRFATQQQKQLHLENLPAKLIGMIKLSNLQAVLKFT